MERKTRVMIKGRFRPCATFFRTDTPRNCRHEVRLHREAPLDLAHEWQTNPPFWCDVNGEAIVLHGFRSTFKDWAAERTGFANEISEMALAHAIEDKTEAAYRRGDLMSKRRKLIEAWAAFCNAAPR